MFRAIRRWFSDPGVPSGLRFMARGFVRWPATVLAVVLVGTVTYGEITRLGAEDFTRGTEGFGEQALGEDADADPSAAPSIPSSGGAGSPSPTRSPRPSPGGDESPPPGGGGGGGTGGSDFSYAVPREGVWRYRVSGSENVNLTGPACSRRYSAGRITVVQRPEDVQLDTEYVNRDGSITHRERRLVTYSDSGVRIHYTEASVYCIQQRNEPAEYDPPLLLFRFPLVVGQPWTSHSESENRSSDLTGEVLRTERVTVAGRTFDTYVVRTLITFTGNQEGERRDTWWLAPSVGMPVKWEESTEARSGPATFRQNATWTLTEMP